MPGLSDVLRAIRDRTGLSTRDFASLVGVQHSSISRYERGKAEPGLAALFGYQQLAEGSEKNAITDAMNALFDTEISEGLRDQAIPFLQNVSLRLAVHLRRPNLKRFAEVAEEIVRRGREVDPAVVEMLEIWRDHADSGDPDARKYFDRALQFLKVSLVSAPPPGGRG